VSIKGVSVEDGVCRAHPYPLVDAKFLTVYPTSDCTVDGEDYATVRLFNVSKEGCSPSGYSQLFYDLSVDTDNAVVRLFVCPLHPTSPPPGRSNRLHSTVSRLQCLCRWPPMDIIGVWMSLLPSSKLMT
jgi:hypothetical protein